jgi:CHAT domain-containing protein
VISTLWPVDDLSTTLLIAHFYWDWRIHHLSPAVALNRAQRWQAQSTDGQKISFIKALNGAGSLHADDMEDMIDDLIERRRSMSANTFAAPYFWAGFVFSGCRTICECSTSTTLPSWCGWDCDPPRSWSATSP